MKVLNQSHLKTLPSQCLHCWQYVTNLTKCLRMILYEMNFITTKSLNEMHFGLFIQFLPSSENFRGRWRDLFSTQNLYSLSFCLLMTICSTLQISCRMYGTLEKNPHHCFSSVNFSHVIFFLGAGSSFVISQQPKYNFDKLSTYYYSM